MSTTTFSGPIRVGKIKTTTGTTLGRNIFNLGQIVMAQTFATGPFGGSSSGNVTDVVIPANSQIVDISIDLTTANGGGASLFSVGDTVGGNATFVNELALSNGRAGLYYLSFPVSQVSGVRTGDWTDIGPVDKKLTWTRTGGTTGAARVTVLYQQNNNLIA